MAYDPKEIEKEVQKMWEEKKVPQKIVKMDWKKDKFYLLDGPPYVNGVPHVGHAKTTIFKDIWGKFKQMQGYSVWWQPGFDCGGLPIENKVEKELGIKSKTEIEEIGVDKFIEACKKFAKGNEPVWLDFYKKVAAWRGWLDPYLTSENYYLESGWWTIKKWFEKGLFVEGYRPGFWCPHCETVLAGIEASESYKNVEDPSITVKFRIVGTDEYLLVFTTTPWTLPANAAIAVHPDEMYVKVEVAGETLIIAEKRLEELERMEKGFKILEKVQGKKLAGLKYEPLLETNSQEEIGKNENAHHVILSIPVMKKRVASKAMIKGEVEAGEEFGHVVTMDVGTGLVHIAPGHGEVDNRLGKHYNLPEVSPVDEKGRFTEDAGKYAGIFVKKADPQIMEDLNAQGKLFHSEKIVHSYPLCWRCKTPLIYRMSHQWFLKLDILREKVIKATEKDVKWLPEFARERYHTVIQEAPDWAVTRQRYWGIPLPVWKCECGSKKVIGSSEELRKESVKKLPQKFDLHKNFVDTVKIKCECGQTMIREKDIMDVWFDSGIAPWASLGYPFQNKELFEKLWKIDLVDESQDQIRAWFNTLMICSFATFGEAPYKTVCLNGWTLDEKGEKMSKSLGNVILAEEGYEKLGADVLRMYICYDVAPWETQKFSLKNAQDLGRQINILWNTYNYFKTYSRISKKRVELRIEDKWLLSKINSLLISATNNMEKFNFHVCARGIMDFITNDLSRTYIKIIRDRSDGGVDFTLTSTLEKLSKIMAPIMPFISEHIYHDMAGKSVHLQKWPFADEEFLNEKLEYTMSLALQIVEAANTIRKENNIKLRWPLKELYVSGDARLKNIADNMPEILKTLCNVKEVIFGDNYKLPSKNLEGFQIYLNTQMDEGLKEEAMLRELLREIQSKRKEKGLIVSDKIILHLDNKKFEKYSTVIKEKVSAEELKFGKIDEPIAKIDFEGDMVSFEFFKTSKK